MTPSTKRCSSIFDLGPLTPKIYSPNLHKIAYKSACMADRPEMFGPTRGFWGWPIQWNHTDVVRPTLVDMATKYGLGAEIQSPTGLVYMLVLPHNLAHLSILYCGVFCCIQPSHYYLGPTLSVVTPKIYFGSYI